MELRIHVKVIVQLILLSGYIATNGDKAKTRGQKIVEKVEKVIKAFVLKNKK